MPTNRGSLTRRRVRASWLFQVGRGLPPMHQPTGLCSSSPCLTVACLRVSSTMTCPCLRVSTSIWLMSQSQRTARALPLRPGKLGRLRDPRRLLSLLRLRTMASRGKELVECLRQQRPRPLPNGVLARPLPPLRPLAPQPCVLYLHQPRLPLPMTLRLPLSRVSHLSLRTRSILKV